VAKRWRVAEQSSPSPAGEKKASTPYEIRISLARTKGSCSSRAASVAAEPATTTAARSRDSSR
jgi:hypothetical protein